MQLGQELAPRRAVQRRCGIGLDDAKEGGELGSDLVVGAVVALKVSEDPSGVVAGPLLAYSVDRKPRPSEACR